MILVCVVAIALCDFGLIQNIESSVSFFEGVPVDIECFPEFPRTRVEITIGTETQPCGKGKAILLVIEPNKAPVTIDFVDWFENTGHFTLEEIDKIVQKIGSKSVYVVGFLEISVPGGSPYVNRSIVYPDDFEPIAGELKATVLGNCKVILIYLVRESKGSLSILAKYGFEPTPFFAVPEMPMGTLAAILASLSPLILKKLKRNKSN